MIRFWARQAEEIPGSRWLWSSLAPSLLVVACVAGLAGCHHDTGTPFEETNYKGVTLCTRVVAHDGKPEPKIEEQEPGCPPVGEKSFMLYHKFELGMTPDQVTKIAGPPQQNTSGTNSSGEKQVHYTYLSDGRIDVTFTDGKINGVSAVGPGREPPTWAYQPSKR